MKKAITVTEQNKVLNPRYLGNRGVGSIVVYNQSTFPRVWRTENWTKEAFHLATAFHEEAGFYPVVEVPYDPATQKLSDIYFSVDNFTYDVIDLTQQEIDQKIQSEAIAISEANKQALIQQALEKQVIEQAQSSDDTASLDNQDLFPFWEVDFDYTIGFKCQDFNANNELKLYKCVQAHTSQSDWRPKDVPALFSVVSYPDEIPVWVQPTGAQDAYNIGDRVHYPTINDPVYESLINANVWSPVAYPQGWQLIP